MAIIGRVLRNYQLNGVEIYFYSIPNECVRNRLKGCGWKWNVRKYCWYKFFSEMNYAFAINITGNDYPVTTSKVVKLNHFVNKNKKELTDEEIDRAEYWGRAYYKPLGKYQAISPKDERYIRLRMV